MDNIEFQPVDENHRCGYVALIGRPNVGKSTLLNALMGMKLSIVTNKPQTTRRRVLGILSSDAYQMILLDTPGIIKPRYGLQEAMMKDVSTSTSDADILVFLADATRDSVDDMTLKYMGGKPAILVLNKIDKVRQEDVLPLVTRYMEAHPFDEVIPVSALKGKNLDAVIETIQSKWLVSSLNGSLLPRLSAKRFLNIFARKCPIQLRLILWTGKNGKTKKT
jgi:GTPase